MKKIILALMMISSFTFSNASTYISYDGSTWKKTSDIYSNPINYGNSPNSIQVYQYISSDDIIFNVWGSGTSVSNWQSYCGTSSCYSYSLNRARYSRESTPTCLPPKEIVNGECINNTPVCQFGYHNDTTPAKTCVPDKECPASMKYFAQATGTFSFDIKTCVPNRDLSPADCASKGGFYATPETPYDSSKTIVGQVLSNKIVLARGMGCYDSAYVQEQSIDNDIAIALSFGTAQIDKAFLARLGNSILSGGKSFANTIFDFFKSDPVASKQGLLTYQPELIDLVIQSDGTYASMNYKLRNEVWQDLGSGNVVQKDYGISTPEIIPPNVYLGGDIAVVENSLIGTKSFLDNPQPLVVPSTSPLNTVTTSTLDLKNSLYGTQTSPFNVTSTLLEKSTDSVGTVLTKTQSKILYPDGSYTNVTTLASRVASGETTYQITASTPVKTASGEVTYNQVTNITTNNAGAVTNTVNNAGSISSTGSSGHVVTTPNVLNPSLAPQTDSNVINLSNIQASLNQLNKTATETKTALQDLVNYVSPQTTALNSKLSEFFQKLTDLSLKIDDGINFVNGLIDSLSDLERQFNDAKSFFDNKPTITLQSGTCPFQSHWYGQTVTVDPCMFIAPYRSINTIFFTLIFSFAVLMFALKYLFDVRLGGK